jgi:hypothetical protein
MITTAFKLRAICLNLPSLLSGERPGGVRAYAACAPAETGIAFEQLLKAVAAGCHVTAA